MFQHRLKVLLVIIGTAFGVLALRLFQLQVVNHEYYQEKAARNIAMEETLPTLRGGIRDRNDIPLAVDHIDYEVAVWLGRLEALPEPQKQQWVQQVSESLGMSSQQVRLAVSQAETRTQEIADQYPESTRKVNLDWLRLRLAQPILTNVPRERVVQLELDEFRLPVYRRGSRTSPILQVRDHTRRVYPQGSSAAHLLGYMARINREEYEEKGYGRSYAGSELKRYRIDELIGRSGLERRYNERLRGSIGIRQVIVDIHGRPQRELSLTPPRRGQDVRLTIDIRLQKLLENALDARLRQLENTGQGHHGGAAVIMDPRNGDILACATAPRYNPNTFFEDYAALSDEELNPMTPLVDRARLGLYPLGSVFKVVVAMAGLQDGKLTGSTEFTCMRFFTIDGYTKQCLGLHGNLRLGQALERSCNIYFYQAGLLVGGTDIHDMAEHLGLGSPTGVDLNEGEGFVPTPRSLPETLNLSIGGGRLLVTPLQAARLMCVFACGRLPRPRLSELQPVQVQDLGLDPVKLSVVRWGMHDVVMGNLGTARIEGCVPGLTYAAKTGTANLAIAGLYDAWYCGFAPFRNPKVAFAAVIERTQEGGGRAAAPVIRDVFASMLSDPALSRYLSEEGPDLE